MGTKADATLKPVREKKGASLMELPDCYVVVDLETTGLDSKGNDIIEFGAVLVQQDVVVKRFASLANPGYPLHPFITQLTGITNDMLASAPPVTTVLPAFLDFVDSQIIIGHNVNFDINFLYDSCIAHLKRPFSNDFIDTMRISRRLFPGERHHRLCDLIERFQIGQSVEHRALADAEQTNDCYQYMKKYVLEHGIDIHSLYWAKASFSAKDIKTTQTQFDENSPVYGKMFVFTGTLDRMDRKKAMQSVVDCGGLCGDRITQKTNYLVLGTDDDAPNKRAGKSAKQKRAEQLKLAGCEIEIISQETFYDMLGL